MGKGGGWGMGQMGDGLHRQWVLRSALVVTSTGVICE